MHLLFLLNSRIIGLLLHLLNDFFFFDLNDFLKLLSHKLTLIYFCFSRPSLLFKLFERFKLKLHIFEFVLEHFHFLSKLTKKVSKLKYLIALATDGKSQLTSFLVRSSTSSFFSTMAFATSFAIVQLLLWARSVFISEILPFLRRKSGLSASSSCTGSGFGFSIVSICLFDFIFSS